MWILNLHRTTVNNIKKPRPSKLLHNIEEVMLKVMDYWSRLKIMTWKWMVLSKNENRINLSYRRPFGFVVRKLKLTVLKPKNIAFQYSM